MLRVRRSRVLEGRNRENQVREDRVWIAQIRITPSLEEDRVETMPVFVLAWRQSYRRNIVLKKTKLGLNFFCIIGFC